MRQKVILKPSETNLTLRHSFFNREVSWLKFNERVLEEAENKKYPILERLKFLSIAASNLDEFYMVRVAGLKSQIAAKVDELSDDGLTPSQQLELVRDVASKLMARQQSCWEKIKLELKKDDVFVLDPKDVDSSQKIILADYFRSNVFPVLTPVAIDPVHPFPFLPNLGISLVLLLRRETDGEELRALLPLPNLMDRFVPIGGAEDTFIALEDLISLNLDLVFPDFSVLKSAWFRVIRDTEFEIDEEGEDLRRAMGSALRQRKHGSIIKLSVNSDINKEIFEIIANELDVSLDDMVRHQSMIGLSDASELYNLDRPDMKFKSFRIRFPERVRELDGDCFAAIRAKDFIVHHPYESFDVVVQFIRQAAIDPNVIAVKQTLYRTSNDSPTVAALIEAAEAGKSVTAMVELKARFDEEANIKWARDLERAGANVVFGFSDKKTHAKISLVVRKEGSRLRSYAHFGTGNYHPDTAKVYTDLSFFTCDPDICEDASIIFNFMTGYSKPTNLKKISVSPDGLYSQIKSLINAEIEHAQNGRPANIIVKVNSLVDPIIISDFYRASNAGVVIQLIVRGVCCLKPGIKGLSENIYVKSIIGRFLEHSRILIFGNGEEIPSDKAKIFITSADLMPRNLYWRVEVMVPLENMTVHRQVMEQVIAANLNDEAQTWKMKSDGNYERVKSSPKAFSAHEYFMTNPSLSGRGKSLEHNPPRKPE